MSAISHTDWTIFCDHDGCPRQLGTNDLDIGPGEPKARDVRRILRRRGWAVSVPRPDNPVLFRQPRLDYCPDHKPKEADR